MRVFIGSSSEARSKVRKVAEILSELGHTPIKWFDQFVAGSYTFDTLKELADEIDAAVFVLSGEDTTWSRDRSFNTVRDNVVFESGLFSGTLGRNRVAY